MLGRSQGTINFAVPGTLALTVHQGFKIFNYRDANVSKVFENNVPKNKIQTEVEAAKSASRLHFSPNLITENIDQKFYTEELVIGQLAKKSARINMGLYKDLYNSHIVDYLVQMIGTDQDNNSRISDIIRKLSAFINDDYFMGLKATFPTLTEVSNFFSDMCNDLGKLADNNIVKCYSHGDFSLENIIVNNHVVKVIDWEGAESRSILNDFYNYFFTEMYFQRMNVSPDIVLSAASKLTDHLDNSMVARSIKFHLDVYRKLFYLERIKTLLERNVNENVVNVTMKSVLLFKAYESCEHHA
jgi:thiamine kinase-like enzyme